MSCTPERLASAKRWRDANPTKIREVNKKHYDKYKESILEKHRNAYAADPNKVRAQGKKWREANPNKLKESHRKSKEKRKDKVREEQRAWRARNKNYHRNWYRLNKDKIDKNASAQRSKKWRNNNPERARENVKRWATKHPECCRLFRQRRRARLRAAAGSCSEEQLIARVTFFGNQCAYCSASWEHIDHTIALVNKGSNWPANLRPACSKCNLKKSKADWRLWKPKI